MKFLIVLVAISALALAKDETSQSSEKKSKRGLIDLGYGIPVSTPYSPLQLAPPASFLRTAPISYASPAVTYGAPAVSYAAPALSYAAPALSYASPAVGYAAPGPVSYARAVPAVNYATAADLSYAISPEVSYAAPALSYTSAPALGYVPATALSYASAPAQFSYAGAPALSYAAPAPLSVPIAQATPVHTRSYASSVLSSGSPVIARTVASSSSVSLGYGSSKAW